MAKKTSTDTQWIWINLGIAGALGVFFDAWAKRTRGKRRLKAPLGSGEYG